MESETPLLFAAPKSYIRPCFWEALYYKKLNELKLNQNNVTIFAEVELGNVENLGGYSFSKESFDTTFKANGVRVRGTLINVNSIEEYRDFDKANLLTNLGKTLHNQFNSSLDSPQTECEQFVLLTFADLKNYKFTYWFGLPAILPQKPFVIEKHVPTTSISLENIYGFFYDQYCSQAATTTGTLFPILCVVDPSGSLQSPQEYLQSTKKFFEGLAVVILDGSNSVNSISWNGRNILHFLQCTCTQSTTIRIIALRNRSIMNCRYESANASIHKQETIERLVRNDSSVEVFIKISPEHAVKDANSLKVIGWEPNERGKAGPRIADLSASLDIASMVSQATDLNLRLMKWRLWPTLNIDQIKEKRCLLLGAGTLGCAVARVLLGWGIKQITFVDNGKVSYSNPARQCLYDFEDARGRKFKALAAAESLSRIVPTIQSSGVILSIPMPGHPYQSSISTENTSENPVLTDDAARCRLDELIRSHDAIFLLTDSRESRWLPTVIAKAYDKLLVNAALGFDTYMVMRHGRRSAQAAACYFCSDIVAAVNSQTNRPLDEQCTVTRPGLAFQASALAVEMMVANLQREFESVNRIDEESLPDQIRGSVGEFSQVSLKTCAFDHCTACSQAIIDAYLSNPVEFCQRACTEDAKYLEELSGITKLMNAVNLEDVMNFGDDDDF